MSHLGKHFTIVEKERDDGVVIATVAHEPKKTFISRMMEAIEEDFDESMVLIGFEGVDDLEHNSGAVPFTVQTRCEYGYTYNLQIENTWFY